QPAPAEPVRRHLDVPVPVALALPEPPPIASIAGPVAVPAPPPTPSSRLEAAAPLPVARPVRGKPAPLMKRLGGAFKDRESLGLAVVLGEIMGPPLCKRRQS